MHPEWNCYKRAPRGVSKQKAIGLRLLPEELARVRRHAAQQHCSVASFTRKMVLAGLANFEQPRTVDHKLSAGGDAVSIRGGQS